MTDNPGYGASCRSGDVGTITDIYPAHCVDVLWEHCSCTRPIAVRDNVVQSVFSSDLEPVPAPSTNPKDLIGLTKPSVRHVPPVAILELGRVFVNGAAKYGGYNWRDQPITASVYYDAIMRHLFAWMDGEDDAEDSGLPHLAHAMSGLAIMLDAKHTSTLLDDRPKAHGATPSFIKANTEKKA